MNLSIGFFGVPSDALTRIPNKSRMKCQQLTTCMKIPCFTIRSSQHPDNLLGTPHTTLCTNNVNHNFNKEVQADLSKNPIREIDIVFIFVREK